MKRCFLIGIIILSFVSIVGCGKKNNELQSENSNIETNPKESQDTELNNPNDEVTRVNGEITELSKNIKDIEITFSSSEIESSSMDTIVVTITTNDNTKLTKEEEESINSIILNSDIDKVTPYKMIKINYKE